MILKITVISICILFIGFVIGYSLYKKKRGKGCCGNCSKCSYCPRKNDQDNI